MVDRGEFSQLPLHHLYVYSRVTGTTSRKMIIQRQKMIVESKQRQKVNNDVINSKNSSEAMYSFISRASSPVSNPGTLLIFKMIEILTTIIVVENREPYYLIIFCKCNGVPLSLFSYQMLASTLTTDEQSCYYKIGMSNVSIIIYNEFLTDYR